MTELVRTSRRDFLKIAAGAGSTLVAAPAVISPSRAQGRTVFVNTWGGSWTAAEDAAFFKPFTQATGIQVRTVAPVSYAKLKAQVQARNYEWDVTTISSAEWLRADREGLAEPIDRSIIDESKLFPGAVFANGIKACALGTNLAYRSDKFPNGGPKSWVDFWDVKKFPGNRSLINNPVRCLVFAIIADGVPKDKVFPIDFDRAFKKLDQIKPHIKVWWTQGNQSQQLVRDGEVDMIAIWNARGSELKVQGVPVEVVWDGATVHTTMWGVAKGAPNAKAAWELIRFAVQPDRQAEFAKRLFYGPSNPAAYKDLSPEVSRQLPTYEENLRLLSWPTRSGRRSTASPCRSGSHSGSRPNRRHPGVRGPPRTFSAQARGREHAPLARAVRCLPCRLVRVSGRVRARPQRDGAECLTPALRAHLQRAAVLADSLEHIPHFRHRHACVPLPRLPARLRDGAAE
jgi:putative spermidine/putrescine transport system substrate-binding protein